MADIFKGHGFTSRREQVPAPEGLFGLSPERLASLCEPIGETKYRIAYRYKNLAIKRTKSHVPKRVLGKEFRVPVSLYTMIRFAIANLSAFEYDQYCWLSSRIPKDFQHHLARAYPPVSANDHCYAVNELVVNDDGSVSKMLRSFGPTDDTRFWADIDRLEKLFLQEKIYFFGIGCNNICVREKADGRLIPVLIDYKRIGIRTFWQQFWLLLPGVKSLKLKRRFNKIRRRFQLD
jgi:hypothetical protein